MTTEQLAAGDAWQLGNQAFRDGKNLDDNPYPAGTTSAEEWRAGFNQACEDELRGCP